MGRIKKSNRNICSICRRSFTKPCLLRRHELVHTKEKLFQCHLCVKSFGQKSTLQRHIKHSHEAVKEHQCTECSRSFAQRVTLEVHIKQTHCRKPSAKKRSLSCPKCTCTFTKLNVLNRHLSSQHKEDDDTEIGEEFQVVDASVVLQQLKSIQSIFETNTKQNEITIDCRKSEKTAKNSEDPISAQANGNNIKSADQSLEEERCNSNVLNAWQCAKCQKSFRTSFQFKRHCRIHDTDRRFKCQYCAKSFITKSKLLEHSKRHILNDKTGVIMNQHQCAICSENFDSLHQLDVHVKTQHADQKIYYFCRTCNKKFKTRSAYKMHKHEARDEVLDALKSLIPEPINLNQKNNVSFLFGCRYCDLKLRDEKCLQNHEKRHESLEKFKCSICPRSFLSRNSLYAHRWKHAKYKEKLHRCTNCPTIRFAFKTQLKRHMQLVHSDLRNFQCNYCDLKFKSKANCKSHMATHLRNLLNEGSTTTDAQDIDINSKNSNEIYSKSELELNVKQVNLKIPQKKPNWKNTKLMKISEEGTETTVSIKLKNQICEYCSKDFAKPSDLERHLRTHTEARPFSCESCSKSFGLKSTLDNHLKTHLRDDERKKFSCQVCAKVYASKKSLMIHQRLHTGSMPFKCEACSKCFRTSGHFIAHKKASDARGHCIPDDKKKLFSELLK